MQIQNSTFGVWSDEHIISLLDRQRADLNFAPFLSKSTIFLLFKKVLDGDPLHILTSTSQSQITFSVLTMMKIEFPEIWKFISDGKGTIQVLRPHVFGFLDPSTYVMNSTVNQQKLPFSDPTHPSLSWRKSWMVQKSTRVDFRCNHSILPYIFFIFNSIWKLWNC